MYADDTTLYCCLEYITSKNKAHTLCIELEGVHSSWMPAKIVVSGDKSK